MLRLPPRRRVSTSRILEGRCEATPSRTRQRWLRPIFRMDPGRTKTAKVTGSILATVTTRPVSNRLGPTTQASVGHPSVATGMPGRPVPSRPATNVARSSRYPACALKHTTAGMASSTVEPLDQTILSGVTRKPIPPMDSAQLRAPLHLVSWTSTNGPVPVPSCAAERYVFRKEVDHAPRNSTGLGATMPLRAASRARKKGWVSSMSSRSRELARPPSGRSVDRFLSFVSCDTVAIARRAVRSAPRRAASPDARTCSTDS